MLPFLPPGLSFFFFLLARRCLEQRVLRTGNVPFDESLLLKKLLFPPSLSSSLSLPFFFSPFLASCCRFRLLPLLVLASFLCPPTARSVGTSSGTEGRHHRSVCARERQNASRTRERPSPLGVLKVFSFSLAPLFLINIFFSPRIRNCLFLFRLPRCEGCSPRWPLRR